MKSPSDVRFCIAQNLHLALTELSLQGNIGMYEPYQLI